MAESAFTQALREEMAGLARDIETYYEWPAGTFGMHTYRPGRAEWRRARLTANPRRRGHGGILHSTLLADSLAEHDC